MPNNIVGELKVVEDVYDSPETTSVTDPTVVESYTPILDEVHEFSEVTSDNADVRVESRTPIPTDIHTHNDTNDIEYKTGVESIMTTLNYSLSNRPLEFLSMIQRLVFFAFLLLMGV